MTTVEPADRAGLHWQPLAATEREALFDRDFGRGHRGTVMAERDVHVLHPVARGVVQDLGPVKDQPVQATVLDAGHVPDEPGDRVHAMGASTPIITGRRGTMLHLVTQPIVPPEE